MSAFPCPWIYPYSPGAQWEIMPQGIYANTALKFCKLFNQYPANLWTLTYGLAPFSGSMVAPLTFSSTALNGGNVHLISVAPAVTATWMPGYYTWQCFVQLNSDATQRYYVSQGTITISPDLTISGTVDTRGKWQKILDEVDAMILATAGDTAEEITLGHGTIGSQTVKGWTRADLINFRDYAANEAAHEARVKNSKAGGPNPLFKYAVMGGSWQRLSLYP